MLVTTPMLALTLGNLVKVELPLYAAADSLDKLARVRATIGYFCTSHSTVTTERIVYFGNMEMKGEPALSGHCT